MRRLLGVLLLGSGWLAFGWLAWHHPAIPPSPSVRTIPWEQMSDAVCRAQIEAAVIHAVIAERVRLTGAPNPPGWAWLGGPSMTPRDHGVTP